MRAMTSQIHDVIKMSVELCYKCWTLCAWTCC